MTYRIVVPCRAAPQGSKRHVGNGILVESSKRLKPFRTLVTQMAIDAATRPQEPITGPVVLRMTTFLRRPQSHFTKKGLRETAPPFPISRTAGDVSKLQRAVEDALTDAGWWLDDGQVLRCEPVFPYQSLKEYEDDPGAAESTVIEVVPV